MSLQLSLPAKLPTTGADLRLRFRRVPEHSYVVRASLRSRGDASPIELGTSYIYGRGEGSSAREQASMHLHLDPRVVPVREDGDRVLTLDVEELDGAPVSDPSVLELIDWELVPSRPAS